jgi:hypothetical protein
VCVQVSESEESSEEDDEEEDSDEAEERRARKNKARAAAKRKKQAAARRKAVAKKKKKMASSQKSSRVMIGCADSDLEDDEAAVDVESIKTHLTHQEQYLVLEFEDSFKAKKGFYRMLDVEYYAQEVRRTENRNVLHLLRDIVEELITPYADREKRFKPFTEVDGLDKFRCCTGETEQSLYAGQVVVAVVKSIVRNGVILRLDNGMRAFCKTADLSGSYEAPGNDMDPYADSGQDMQEEKDRKWMESRVAPEMTVTARVVWVDIDGQKVGVSAKTFDVADTQSYWGREMDEKRYPDRFLYKEARDGKHAEDAAYLLELAKRSQNRFTNRTITHPLFQNITSEQARVVLEEQNANEGAAGGEYPLIIHPSTSSASRLTITFSVDNVFFNASIQEKNKPDAASLGTLCVLVCVVMNKLYIFICLSLTHTHAGRTLIVHKETYEDLDEVVERFVHPVIECARAVITHPKYLHGDRCVRLHVCVCASVWMCGVVMPCSLLLVQCKYVHLSISSIHTHAHTHTHTHTGPRWRVHCSTSARMPAASLTFSALTSALRWNSSFCPAKVSTLSRSRS